MIFQTYFKPKGKIKMLVLKRLIKDILSFFVFLRFKDEWALMKHLETNGNKRGICEAVYDRFYEKKCSYIGVGAKFAEIPFFPHGVHGIHISKDAVIGKNAIIFHNVTIGSVTTKGSKKQGSPVIGDNCYIGAGASIIGNVKIGNNCRIGANAVVYEDMPDNSVALCSPTRIITKEEPLDNRFYILKPNGEYVVLNNGKFENGKNN